MEEIQRVPISFFHQHVTIFFILKSSSFLTAIWKSLFPPTTICDYYLWISYIENISISVSVKRSQIEDFSWFQNRSFRSIFCSSFFQFNFFRFMRFNSLVEAGLAVNKDQGRPIPSHGPLGQRLRLWVSYYLHSFEPKPRPIRKTKRIFIFKWIFPTVDFLLYTVFDCNEWHVSKD